MTFLNIKVQHHALSLVMPSYTNSEEIHAAQQQFSFHENYKLKTNKIDKTEHESLSQDLDMLRIVTVVLGLVLLLSIIQKFQKDI